MNVLQEKLLLYPITNIIFHSPLAIEKIEYEDVVFEIPMKFLNTNSVLFLSNVDDCEKVLTFECMMSLIQDSKIKAIIINSQKDHIIDEDILQLLQKESVALIQLTDKKLGNKWICMKDENQSNFISSELQLLMGSDIETILFNLAKGMNFSFIYLNEDYQTILEMGESKDIITLQRWLNKNLRNLVLKEVNLTDSKMEIIDIFIANLMEHHLIVKKDLKEWQKKWLNKVVNLLALFVHTNTLFLEQQLKLKEHFIYDLLFKKFESEAMMIKQGNEFGWNLENPHFLFVIDYHVDHNVELIEDEQEHLFLFIENWTKTNNIPMFFVNFQGQIVAFLEETPTVNEVNRKRYIIEVIRKLLDNIKEQFKNTHLAIGIGNYYDSSINLNKCYQEAKLALRFGRYWNEEDDIFHINDLGVFRLLIYNHEEILRNYSEEYLRELLLSDREQGTDYIETLRSYIKHHGNIIDVSNDLYIHTNTLRNRLKKIEKITGINLSDLQQISNLIIAIKIATFIEPNLT